MPSTTAPVDTLRWHRVNTQELPAFIPTAEVEQRVRVEHSAPFVPKPDPGARRRMAKLLYAATGWSIFPEVEHDRAYVSRLWAEDWDSPEDSRDDDN